MANLEDVITESLEDATLPTEPVEAVAEVESPEPVEAAPEAPEAPVDTPVETPETPVEKKEPVEDFDKKYGVSAQSLSGRENRIPYSRVKKITEKAAKEAAETKAKEFEPKLAEYETKLKDYETKFSRVTAFEDTLINKPDQFLQLLSTIPAYAPFFAAIEEAFTKANGTQPQTPVEVTDDMPAPNHKLADGSMVYDRDGLKALMEWQAKQVETRVTKQVEERYKPIESEWQAQQRIQAIVPHVNAQIAEARTWPQFNENEDEIVAALQANKKLSLEGAYRQVVFPKLQAEKDKLSTDRKKIREEVLAELKKAPKSTSASTTATKAEPTVSSGPRDLEDVIREQIKTLK
jgi:hypothetical protein